MRKIIMLLAITIAVSTAAFGQNKEMPLTGSKEAVTLYLQGRAIADKQEDPGTLFEQAIQKDPDFAMAYLVRGTNTNQEFRRNLEKAVSLADKVSPGEREWIMSAQKQSDGDQVGRKAHLDQLLKLHPEDKRVQSRMASYYRSQGDETTALRYFTQSVKIDKNFAPAYNNIGFSNMALGKFADAEKAFKTYIELLPKSPNPYDSYAEMLMRTGKYDEAIVQFNKALALDPTFLASYRGIANSYVYKGSYAKAQETYRLMFDKAQTDGMRNQALVGAMNAYLAEGNSDKALEMTQRLGAIAEKAGDVQAQIGYQNLTAIILLESNKVDDSIKFFAKAALLNEDPSLPAANRENRRLGPMMNRARLLIAQEQFGPAKAQLDEIKLIVASRNPNQQRGYNMMVGLFELKQKNYARAIESFAKANPDDPFVWYYNGMAHEGAGDPKSAAALYRKIADWNRLDGFNHALVSRRAAKRMAELDKLSK